MNHYYFFYSIAIAASVVLLSASRIFRYSCKDMNPSSSSLDVLLYVTLTYDLVCPVDNLPR